MAQLVARLVRIEKVRGSNPLSSTTIHDCFSTGEGQNQAVTTPEVLGSPKPTWGVARSLVVALLAQVLVCLIAWSMVDDSVAGGWKTDDFNEWVVLSGVAAGCLVVLAGVSTRRWRLTCAVAAGCLLGVCAGLLVFLVDAGIHSA